MVSLTTIESLTNNYLIRYVALGEGWLTCKVSHRNMSKFKRQLVLVL